MHLLITLVFTHIHVYGIFSKLDMHRFLLYTPACIIMIIINRQKSSGITNIRDIYIKIQVTCMSPHTRKHNISMLAFPTLRNLVTLRTIYTFFLFFEITITVFVKCCETFEGTYTCIQAQILYNIIQIFNLLSFPVTAAFFSKLEICVERRVKSLSLCTLYRLFSFDFSQAYMWEYVYM